MLLFFYLNGSDKKEDCTEGAQASKSNYQITLSDQKDGSSKPESIIPYPLRYLLAGSSSCRKTMLLLNFIHKNWFPYKYPYTFNKSLIKQEAYKKLDKKYKNIEGKIDTSFLC